MGMGLLEVHFISGKWLQAYDPINGKLQSAVSTCSHAALCSYLLSYSFSPHFAELIDPYVDINYKGQERMSKVAKG